MSLTFCDYYFRDREPKRAPAPDEEEQDQSPPTFERTPEAVRVEEGDTAKFLVKVNGYPRPRLTWWVNGAIVVNVSLSQKCTAFELVLLVTVF